MRHWLLEMRKKKSLTQEDVATKCGITRQFYSMIEKGKRNPSIQVAKEISKLFDFPWITFFENNK